MIEEGCISNVSGANSKRINVKIEQRRSYFDHLFSDKECIYRLIIPIIQDIHFFVLVVDFSHLCREIFVKFDFYDSLASRRPARGVRKAALDRSSSDMVAVVNKFFRNFFFHDLRYKKLFPTHSDCLKKTSFH